MTETARWLEVSFVSDGAQAEAWSDALLAAGALSVRTEDADADGPLEQALFGEPGEPDGFHAWPSTRITALVDSDLVPAELVAGAASAAGLMEPQALEVAEVGERDWVAATQAQFEPIEIGERLRITPSWHREHQGPAGLSADGRAEIVLDPGLAFGTGSHPTTGMCLQWL